MKAKNPHVEFIQSASKKYRLANRWFAAAVCAGLLFYTGCSSSNEKPVENGQGTVSLNLSASGEILPMSERSGDQFTKSTEFFQVPQPSDFKIQILGTNGAVVKTWDSYASMPSQVRLTQGSYTMKATYGPEHEGGIIGEPRFGAAVDFAVSLNEATPVSLKCTMADVMITAEYTEGFKNYFKDYKLTFYAGNELLEFPKDETKAAFFSPGNITSVLSLTMPDGSTGSYTPSSLSNAKAAEHYKFKFDVGTSGAGGAQLIISFDEPTTKDPIKVDVDDIGTVAAPFYTLDGFESGDEFTFTEGEVYTAGNLSALVTARARIASCKLVTTSPELIAIGWPAEVDLVGISPEMKTKMQGFGLKWTEELAGLNMAVIDFKGIAEYMPAGFDQEVTNDISVITTDTDGQQSEQLQLLFTVGPPEFTLVPITGALAPSIKTNKDATYTINIAKGNGKKITFQYYDPDWDRWHPVNWTASGARFKVSGIDWSWQTVKVRAYYGNRYSEIDQATKNPSLSATAYNIFTSKAIFRLSGPEKAEKYFDEDDFSVEISSDNAATWNPTPVDIYIDGAFIFGDVTGLIPGTAYKAKVSWDAGAGHGPVTKEVSFTTESQAQLPNSSFESWDEVTWYNHIQKGGRETYTSGLSSAFRDYIYVDFCHSQPTGWMGVNEKTIPASANPQNTWYMSPSLLSSTSAQEGSFGAWIRNVAWHNAGEPVKDNTPSPLIGSNKNQVQPPETFYRSVGKLFLGDYSYDHSTGTETYTYGVPFTSRPSALEGYYRYLPVGSDTGIAEVILEARSGNRVTTLATGTASLTSNDTYVKFSIPLDYGSSASKATHIRVLFAASSNYSDDQSVENETVQTQQHTNDLEWRMLGSWLYIDNLTLVYE